MALPGRMPLSVAGCELWEVRLGSCLRGVNYGVRMARIRSRIGKPQHAQFAAMRPTLEGPFKEDHLSPGRRQDRMETRRLLLTKILPDSSCATGESE